MKLTEQEKERAKILIQGGSNEKQVVEEILILRKSNTPQEKDKIF